jgi:hypothetical protein
LTMLLSGLGVERRLGLMQSDDRAVT